MSLSPYEANIRDFNALISNHPHLLTEADRQSLIDLITAQPDNVEQISDALAVWCEEHPKVLDALLEMPVSDTAERAAGGRETRMSPQEAKEEVLDNVVRPSSMAQNHPSNQHKK